MEKQAGIYKFTSPTGKIYIGQSWNISHRLRNHRYNVGRFDLPLYMSFLKYGIVNHTFEILHILPQDTYQVIMDTYELLYVSQYREAGFKMLNLKDGGRGGRMSEETKRKMRISSTGFKHSEATKLKMSLVKKGKLFTEEHKRKISDCKKGEAHPLFGKKHSPETRLKMSLSAKGKTFTDEHKKNMRKLKPRK